MRFLMSPDMQGCVELSINMPLENEVPLVDQDGIPRPTY